MPGLCTQGGGGHLGPLLVTTRDLWAELSYGAPVLDQAPLYTTWLKHSDPGMDTWTGEHSDVFIVECECVFKPIGLKIVQ